MPTALARRRLLRDLAEVQREPSELVSALPLESNLFEWHANLRPSSGPLAGVVLHVRITFPHNYPDAPPNLLFPMDKIPSFVHPNLYSFGLCLDILSSFIGRRDERAGWSPAYSVRTLLLQLQSFLFEFDAAPQDHGGRYSARACYDERRIAKVRSEAAWLKCSCGHCGQRAWPPLAAPSPQPAPTQSPSSPGPRSAPAPEDAMPATEAAVSLRRVQQLRLQAERALSSASDLKRRTEGGLRAAGSAIHLVGAAGATQAAVRVVDIASSGHVCLGFAVMGASSSHHTSLCPQSVGWDSRGRLSLGKAVKVQKLALPSVSRGDVMEISVLEKAIEFRLNGKAVEAAAPLGSLLWGLVAAGEHAAGTSEALRPVVTFREAVIEVLADEQVQVSRQEVERLREEERQLEAQVLSEEQQWREQKEAAAREEARKADELRRAAERERAAEAWARVLAPPRPDQQQVHGSRKMSRQQLKLRAEIADLAKPLQEGSSSSPWALLRPPLLLSAFMHLEASSIASLSRTCRVWRRLATRSSLMERVQLRCFYMKTSAEEDTLGFGVNVEYHEDGNLKALTTELDALSATAFHSHGLRRGVWGENFKHFLPLILDAEHGRRAMPLLEQALAALASGPEGAPSAFEPWMALAVLPQLMNSFVVALMSSGADAGKGGIVPRHASERALLGYCSFHHMLLALCQRHPSIAQVATEKLQRFVQGERVKAKVPDLGQLIVYMAATDEVQWRDVAAAVLSESHIRGALWVLRDQPQLGRDLDDKARLSRTLTSRLTSARLLMFQAYFLRSIARPQGETLAQGLARYSRQFGQPTEPQKEMLVAATREILAVDSWPEVYRRVGLRAPGPAELAEELREAMVRSAELGYHSAAALGPFGRFAASLRRPGGAAAPRSGADRVGVQASLQQAFAPLAGQATAAAAPSVALLGPSRPQLSLTMAEEAEARKIEKTLREIEKLEERLGRGEKLDRLQLEKVKRRQALEGTLVMHKVRAGYTRPVDRKSGC